MSERRLQNQLNILSENYSRLRESLKVLEGEHRSLQKRHDRALELLETKIVDTIAGDS